MCKIVDYHARVSQTQERLVVTGSENKLRRKRSCFVWNGNNSEHEAPGRKDKSDNFPYTSIFSLDAYKSLSLQLFFFSLKTLHTLFSLHIRQQNSACSLGRPDEFIPKVVAFFFFPCAESLEERHRPKKAL